jgi:hypothetical protein
LTFSNLRLEVYFIGAGLRKSGRGKKRRKREKRGKIFSLLCLLFSRGLPLRITND